MFTASSSSSTSNLASDTSHILRATRSSYLEKQHLQAAHHFQHVLKSLHFLRTPLSNTQEDVKLPIPLQCDTLWTFWRSLFPDAGSTAPGATLSKCAITFLGSAVGLDECGGELVADATETDAAAADTAAAAGNAMEFESSGGGGGFVTALQRRSIGGTTAVSSEVQSVQQFVQKLMAGAASVVAYIMALIRDIMH
jgi:hypothetical protein